MTAEEYRQKMIQAFHNADCDELIAVVCLPTEKEFEHLEWLLKTHYKKESCTDAISRQAVIEMAYDLSEIDGEHFTEPRMVVDVEDIKNATSVTPAEKVGRWIPVGYDGYADGYPVYDWWECSECEWEHTGDEDTLTPYCPNCGANMQDEYVEPGINNDSALCDNCPCKTDTCQEGLHCPMDE